ncbi:MAG: hypothetical protein U0401_31485 [Anaerolineae bacterium]
MADNRAAALGHTMHIRFFGVVAKIQTSLSDNVATSIVPWLPTCQQG